MISEEQFKKLITNLLKDKRFAKFQAVTGPGRSGAVASVYASYILKIPFVPFGQLSLPKTICPILIIDTVENSGKTLRQASSKYTKAGILNETAFVIKEPPRKHLWYEYQKK